MEIFPSLNIGLLNGWILILLFFGVYGILLLSFPKEAATRLYDRSGQPERSSLRRAVVAILVLLWIIMVCLTPLKFSLVAFGVGISLYTLGLLGFVIALVNFKNTPSDQPVTQGLYRISRHPQQFSISLAFLGTGLAIGSWVAFLFMILAVVGGHAKVLAEEEACLKQYGESYQQYLERIPRYFLFF
jgi:protein-S-isoprenylcysteine O-methyltransferase Ste14